MVCRKENTSPSKTIEEIQRLREMLPLDNNSKFVTSLDYSLTTEYNQWRLSELTTIQNVKTNTDARANRISASDS